jgi:tetratricopeptide (TPR) repeat protein
MCRCNQHRWLPVFAVLAALAIEPCSGFGEVPYDPFAQPQAQNLSPIPSSQPSTTAPQTPPTPEELGDALLAHQRYQAAIEAYKKAPASSANAWNKMGIAYQMMFNLNDATRCYQASLKLSPRDANVLNNLGTVYDAQKDYGSAERMYRKALKLDPKSAIIYKNLGTALLVEHNFKKGWAAYKEALAFNPQIFEDSASPKVQNPASVEQRGAMNYYMARGCVRAGMNDRAIEYLRIALNEGFTNRKKIEADREFASLRSLPAFEQMLRAQGTP